MDEEYKTRVTPPSGQDDSLDSSVERSRQAWQQLGKRFRSITPGGLVRFALFIGAIAAIGWVVWVTWVALTPFVVGAVVAYIALPLVNRLDQYMPRTLSILLTLTLFVGGVGLFLWLLIPVLSQELYRAYLNLPDQQELRSYMAQLNNYIASLPEPTQVRINTIYTQLATDIQADVDVYATTVLNALINTVFGLLNTIGFVLGFLVVPAWLLSVLQDQKRGQVALNRYLPNWLKSDFWAVLRIFDRAFGAFVRGQFLMAFVTAGLVYLGLEIVVRLFGLPGDVRYQLLLAVLAGLFQLIPSIGPFLGVIPGVLVGLRISFEVTAAILVVYIAAQQIVINFVAPKIERRIINVHPAILILVIVALSEFGFWWILLAAPITAVLRDLFRYTYGRFSDSPQPAGILPGEAAQPAAASPQPAVTTRTRMRSIRRPVLRRAGSRDNI